MAWRRWRFGPCFGMMILILVATWAVVQSPPLAIPKPDIPAEQHQIAQRAKHENSSLFLTIGAWASDNKDIIEPITAIGALAAAAVLAVVTGFLWGATKGLAKSTEDLAVAATGQINEMALARNLAERQLTLTEKRFFLIERQVDIAQKQLMAQGPFLQYDVYVLQVTPNEPERIALVNYRIALRWKNSGKDFATNVTYNSGHGFELNTGNEIEWRKEIGERFRNTIYRMSYLEGKATLGPDHTFETDQITILPDTLRLLYRKELRLLVWCVVGYGSRLQPDDWFAETAINLEFVMDQNPDTFMLTDKETTVRPFRVAIVGSRYRTANEPKT